MRRWWYAYSAKRIILCLSALRWGALLEASLSGWRNQRFQLWRKKEKTRLKNDIGEISIFQSWNSAQNASNDFLNTSWHVPDVKNLESAIFRISLIRCKFVKELSLDIRYSTFAPYLIILRGRPATGTSCASQMLDFSFLGWNLLESSAFWIG